jgi:hypothetical protein
MSININALLLLPMFLIAIVLSPVFLKLTLLPVLALSLASIVK